jgi:hypothetical protein
MNSVIISVTLVTTSNMAVRMILACVAQPTYGVYNRFSLFPSPTPKDQSTATGTVQLAWVRRQKLETWVRYRFLPMEVVPILQNSCFLFTNILCSMAIGIHSEVVCRVTFTNGNNIEVRKVEFTANSESESLHLGTGI